MPEIEEMEEEANSSNNYVNLCSIDVVENSSVKFSINYDNLPKEEKEIKEEIKEETKEEIKEEKEETKITTSCQYKRTMNEEWKGWIKRQIGNKVCLSKITEKLKKQNYSQDVINYELYFNNTINNQEVDFNAINITDKKFVEKKKVEVVDQFPNTFLEIGDYFPFMKIGSKEIHNLTDNKFILLVCIDYVNSIDFNTVNILRQQHHVFIIYNNNTGNKCTDNLSIENSKAYNILKIPDENINIYVLNANRRIVDIKNIEKLEKLTSIQLDKYTINMNIHVPYILLENVLSPELLEEVLAFYDNNAGKRELHNSASKNRLHVHPDIELEKKIDNKLSRSLFPEIRKIFYFDIKYRELYKICSYDAETSGRFNPHRDTVYPHQHRKFALSLLLNDDYEGGEFFLPEYNAKIKPKANTAIVFPGICSHQVLEVTKGSRRTIITFFCTERGNNEPTEYKNKLKSNFYDERKVQHSAIYPF